MMRAVQRSVYGVVIAIALAHASTARGALAAIGSPNAAYVGATNVISLIDPDGTQLTSVSGTDLFTISFSNVREVHTVPDGGWLTWASPPDTESATPRVLTALSYNPNDTSLTLNFGQPVKVFGVEVEGDPFDTRVFTADFYNGVNLVGQVSRQIHGEAGARLLAASASGTDVFTSVVISTDIDFAIAQLRYGYTSIVPEPSSMTLTMMAMVGLALAMRRTNARWR